METVLAQLARALEVDQFAAGALLCWALVLIWGVALIAVSYRSRRWERAQMQDPPTHPYFPWSESEP